jgi:hypothetical protein
VTSILVILISRLSILDSKLSILVSSPVIRLDSSVTVPSSPDTGSDSPHTVFPTLEIRWEKLETSVSIPFRRSSDATKTKHLSLD